MDDASAHQHKATIQPGAKAKNHPGKKFESRTDNLNIVDSGLKPTQTIHEIVDIALAENRNLQHLLIILCSILTLVGIGLLIWGAIIGKQLMAIGGGFSLASILFVLYFMYKIRTDNIAIRLLAADHNPKDNLADKIKLFEKIAALGQIRNKGN